MANRAFWSEQQREVAVIGCGFAFPFLRRLECTHSGQTRAHTPGQPRTLKDFLFILEIFAIPLAVLIYTITASPNWKDMPVAADAG